jgi:hypothetical protein
MSRSQLITNAADALPVHVVRKTAILPRLLLTASRNRLAATSMSRKSCGSQVAQGRQMQLQHRRRQ